MLVPIEYNKILTFSLRIAKMYYYWYFKLARVELYFILHMYKFVPVNMLKV